MNLSYLESFEQNLIDKYGVQIHTGCRNFFYEDRFWDINDEFSPVRSGTSYDAFHLYIKESNDNKSEKQTFQMILKHLDLVSSLIEMTRLRAEDLNQHLQNKQKRASYVELDYTILACTFAQVVKYGTVTDEFMKIFITSILRQLNPTLNYLVCNGNKSEMDRRCNLIEDLSQFIVAILKHRGRGV